MFSRSSVKLQSARCHSILLNRLFQSSTWFLEYAVRVVGLGCPALVISNQQYKGLERELQYILERNLWSTSGEVMRAFIFVYLTTGHAV